MSTLYQDCRLLDLERTRHPVRGRTAPEDWVRKEYLIIDKGDMAASARAAAMASGEQVGNTDPATVLERTRLT